MTWNIRRGKPQPFDDYLLTPGRHIATMQHYDKANVVCDEYEYKQEGALLYYMDLPRKGFEQHHRTSTRNPRHKSHQKLNTPKRESRTQICCTQSCGRILGTKTQEIV